MYKSVDVFSFILFSLNLLSFLFVCPIGPSMYKFGILVFFVYLRKDKSIF